MLSLRSDAHTRRETPDAKAQHSIGVATMEDGTIALQLRAEGPQHDVIGDARLRYPPHQPQYEEILKHLGGLEKSQTKPVSPWPEK
jgi:hypothetical protein